MDRKKESRLKKDLVAWLCTVGAESRPHATLVWFLWDGESLRVYSVPGVKTRDIETNPNVELHLNSDADGSEMVRIDGTAVIAGRQPPAAVEPAYKRKYRASLKALGYTWDQFAAEYFVEIRIRAVRVH